MTKRVNTAQQMKYVFAILVIGCLCVFFTSAYTTKALNPPPQSGGSISGKITFPRVPPKNTVWTVTKNKNICGHEKPLDRIIVDKNGGVANAFIYVKDMSSVHNTNTGTKYAINQHECRYAPHAQVVPVGATVTVSNSDDVLHNIHGYFFADHSTAFNIAQPIQNQQTPVPMNKPGLIEVQCDAGHTWMNAYIYVADNPYVAVSASDGSFSINNVPSGNYTIECWHEGWNVTDDRGGASDFLAAADTRSKHYRQRWRKCACGFSTSSINCRE